MKEPERTYGKEIKSRLQAAGCKLRKDSIKYIDTMITASPEFFKEHAPPDIDRFFKKAYEFIAGSVGEGNIFSAVVHLDERTPHMHLCFTPITPDGRLSAKEILGNRETLIKWQDNYYDHMVKDFPDLERGEPAAETGRRHIPVRMFKQATALTEQMEVIRDAIEKIRPETVLQDRAEISGMVSEWLPKVGSFNAQLQRLERGSEELKAAFEETRRDSGAVKEKYDKATKAYLGLKSDFTELKGFVDSIPNDIKTDLFENYNRLKEIHDGLNR